MYKKKQIVCLCLVLLALSIPPIAIAAEKGTVADDTVKCTVEPYVGKLFPGLYKTTEQTAKKLCAELVKSKINSSNKNTGSILMEFADQSKKALDDLKLDKSGDYINQFLALRTTFKHFGSTNTLLPEFRVMPSIEDGPTGSFETLEETTARFAINEVEYCATVSAGSSCTAIFEEFTLAFNPYRSAYNKAYNNTKQLSELGKQWDQFLEVSKSQTALEVLLTTMVNNKHFKTDHLVGPPSLQVIALHPQLIYDSMEKTPDGSNQELGLAVEWAGVNFWNLKVPLGISLASVYVDRANSRDVGHGVMVHINNHYAIGWANYGHDMNSGYVTIDLLKMFEDKKAKYDEYVKSYL